MSAKYFQKKIKTPIIAITSLLGLLHIDVMTLGSKGSSSSTSWFDELNALEPIMCVVVSCLVVILQSSSIQMIV
ncbi:uncharacterized protein PHALS_15159 [Plasmopara halstedii]|uniref:Uncharacterized protein n=1 Tax=Plasmopara halstedii TaxID=4781 RepID=A0A0P1B3W9_PLAHL|nr:uncharacterized protein PHALS_15159 [Plasmopara halstedii]CEG48598.1 hypothetical protein PHALS_15159 [Plasmopara halstedii]|eukprot:XP_024584967.1 hypothetical protein PHALS_15159 [Plasmopara halstedii]